MTVTDHRDLVTALLGVDGVAEAAVERGDTDDDLGSLRLQLLPGADEVAVAGAVNALLRQRFGLAVDTDRVRVLEETASASPARPAEQPVSPDHRAPAAPDAPEPLADPDERGSGRPDLRPTGEAGGEEEDGSPRAADEEPPLSPARMPTLPTVQMARPSRVTIQRVQMLTADLGVVATIVLGLEGRTFEGRAEGAATVTGVNRAVATATLRAIEGVVDRQARFEVEHLEVAVSGRERTALVVVTMLTGRGSERLSGASVVREDVRQAVIRSVLAAVNRRLEPLLEDL